MFVYQHTELTHIPIRHIVNPTTNDETACGEYVDPTEYHADSAHADVSHSCLYCPSMYEYIIREQARREIAQELMVDESEVF